MSTYLFDTETKRAIKHREMLLQIINKSKTTNNEHRRTNCTQS